jgi:predicted enzyme related to lactoylglutathione lyase
MREDGKIDYVEFPAGDLTAVKAFYATAFGWGFTDYGPAYAAIEEAGLDGGFDANAAEAPAKPFVVLYADNLETMQAKILAAGGAVTKPIFSFPGGRRFHFRDPSGNELGVWSVT